MLPSPTALAAPAVLRWPLPAVLAWLVCWAVAAALRGPFGAGAAALAGCALGIALAWRQPLRWRRALVAGGYPLSLLAGLPFALPPWLWLLPLAVLAAVYPLRAWRDAPLFPTPAGALDALADRLPLSDGARLLDAGCGVGDGLRALRSAWPAARVEGVEWSWLLALVARLRCPWAAVQRGDMWAADWAGLDLVYLYQRPESMGRAWAKACAEMAPGSWLVSLEFGIPARAPELAIAPPGARAVYAWRVPAQDAVPRVDI